MSTAELDVPPAASAALPAVTLRSPLKRYLNLSSAASIIPLFSSPAPLTASRQPSAPATPTAASNSSSATTASPPSSSLSAFSAVVHTSPLQSLYRRISSRLPSPVVPHFYSPNSTSLLMPPAHKPPPLTPIHHAFTATSTPPSTAATTTASTSSAPSHPSHSTTTLPPHLTTPLPLPTLRLLTAHSTRLASLSTHVSMLASFFYLVLNATKSHYHAYAHSPHVVVWCDVLLVGVNVMGVWCAVGYWCAYAERRRVEWEVERRRLGLLNGGGGKVGLVGAGGGLADELGGVEGDVDGGGGVDWNGPANDEVDEESLDVTEGEVQNLLLQHSSLRLDDSPSLPSNAPTPSPSAYYPLTSLLLSLRHLLSALSLTLFHSQTFYISTLAGATELLALSGAFLYLISSLFPLLLDPHWLALREETEATLDELGYTVDSLAMTLYVVSSLLYLSLYYRGRQAGGQAAGAIWLDGGFWSNVWNVGGSLCYLFAIGYGLSIRLHTSSALPPSSASPVPSAMGAALLGLNGTAVGGTVAADDLSDLSDWQRALYGLRSSEKLMTSAGDLMYMMCAVMMEIAERQDRRRRANKGRTRASSAAGGGGKAGADMAEVDGGSGAVVGNGLGLHPKWSARRRSEAPMPSTDVVDVDVT